MPRNAERGGPQTRARIREVANRLFLERGYNAVTVAEIAREAGFSSVTVFNHFPRKEDLFLDRSSDAIDALRGAVRDRASGVTVLASLRDTAFRLFDERHPLSGVNPLSGPFYRTVAESAELVARARAIASELQNTLARELDGDERFGADSGLFAALFIAGYSSVLVQTASRSIAGEQLDALVDDHRARLERLFAALSDGFGDAG